MSPVRQSPENLSSVVKIGAVVLVVCLGLWGCARKPASRTGGDGVLESKVQKLEQDLRTASQARDKARRELSVLEGEAARLQLEANEKVALAEEKANLLLKLKAGQAERDQLNIRLAARTSERDDLLVQVAQRIQERDNLYGRVDKLRKGLQTLLTQDDNPGLMPGTLAQPASTGGPAAAVSGPTLGRQS